MRFGNYPPPPSGFISAVTFTVGQAVPWPAAPDGVAQVEELCRVNVVLLYPRGARLCRRRVRAAELARLCTAAPLLPGVPDNPFCRGIARRRSKQFTT